jgi:ribosomal protein S27AE
MPHGDGFEVQADVVNAWMAEFSPGLQACGFCGAFDWNADGAVKLPHFGPVDFEQPSTMVVVVPVRCCRCGYTLFLNARTVGLTAVLDPATHAHAEREMQ